MADSPDSKPKRRILVPAAKPPAPPPQPPQPVGIHVYVPPSPPAARPPAPPPPATAWDYMRTSAAREQARFDREVGSSPMADLLRWLGDRLEPKRMAKALDMLKASSFQLFAEITDAEVVGVVRSQFDADKVYSARMLADGHYCCTNQALEYCGGMRGLPCKHMLVLLVGLTQAGKLHPDWVRGWVTKVQHLPERYRVKMDAEKQSMTFIKYKGAQAGEIDWRPTETLPEDFYAL